MSDSDSSPKKVVKPKVASQHPTFLSMAVEAVTSVKDTKGVSVPAIRNFITEKYKTVDVGTLRFRLKQALTKALEKGTLIKSKATAEKPLLMSRFKLNKENLLALEKAKAKKEKAKEKTEKTTKKTTTAKKTKSAESPKKKTTKAKTSPKKATKTKKAPKTPEKKVKPKAKAVAKSTVKTIKTPKKTTKKSASGKVKAK